ncbi:MAG TPA: hypothetical protein VGD37_03440 [Kofleriaceae bacterium]|jgi:hypothetical protein
MLAAVPLLVWAPPAGAEPEPAAPAPQELPGWPTDDASPEPPAAPPRAAEPEPPAAPDDAPQATPAPSVDTSPDARPASPEASPESPAAPDAPAAGAAAPHGAAAPDALIAMRTAGAVSSGSRRFGAMADLGLPDGATVSIVYRPIRAIRLHAGLSHNLISLGQRAGITWVPLSWWASPTLSVEYGHYADGNANPLVRAVSGDTTFSSAVLDRVGYNYANAHLGFELGRKWFTFYVHAGASRITGTVHNLTAATMSESAGTTSVMFSKDPTVQLWSVSARLGFIVYLAK